MFRQLENIFISFRAQGPATPRRCSSSMIDKLVLKTKRKSPSGLLLKRLLFLFPYQKFEFSTDPLPVKGENSNPLPYERKPWRLTDCLPARCVEETGEGHLYLNIAGITFDACGIRPRRIDSLACGRSVVHSTSCLLYTSSCRCRRPTRSFRLAQAHTTDSDSPLPR